MTYSDNSFPSANYGNTYNGDQGTGYSQKQNSGCWKWGVIGCGTIILIGVIFAFISLFLLGKSIEENPEILDQIQSSLSSVTPTPESQQAPQTPPAR